MLELKNVYKYYSNNGVTSKGLINVNLKLNRGEIVVITGESGSGKSTLLNVITKQDTFDEGEIYYLGNETSFFSVDDMDFFRKNKVGFIFQNYNIIDSYTVLENVMLPLIINDVPYKEAKAEAMEIIKKVGLEKWAKHRGTKLSGGQKQRCVIARALASRCDILACDEPTGNLDSQTGNEIVNLIKEVTDDKLVLIVTHNYEQFEPIATRKIKLHDGEIIEDSEVHHKETHPEEETLDLEYIPVKKKTDIRIALNNLKSTPKKTFLMSMIIMFTAIFALFLYCFIGNGMEDRYERNPFMNQQSNLLLAYDGLNHSELDLSSIESKYNISYNEYYAKDAYEFGSTSDSFLFGFYNNPKKLHADYGRLPSAGDEIMVIINANNNTKKSAIAEYKQLFEGKTIDAYHRWSNVDLDFKFKIVGMQLRTDVSYDHYIITSSNEECLNTLKKVFLAKYIYEEIGNGKLSCHVVSGNNTKINYVSSSDDYDFSGDNPNYIVSDKKIFKDGLPVYKIDGEDARVDFYVGDDIEDYMYKYEAFIYGNEKSAKKDLKNLGYDFVDISSYDESTKIERFMMNLSLYSSIISSTVVLLLVYLISAIILERVFSSKIEAYAIFRTLGVTKKDMKTVLSCEVMTLIICISIINYLVFLFFGKIIKLDNEFFRLYRNLNFGISVWYFIVMLCIGVLMSRKFNRKLFKSSVSKTLKGGE